MIVVTASGFIPEKPRLNVFANSQNCKFDVVAIRRENQNGEWVNVYERASFVVWGQEAERVASRLDSGHTVMASGRQKTSRWTDDGGSQRSKVEYELLSWERLQTSGSNHGEGPKPAGNEHSDRGTDTRRYGSPAPQARQPQHHTSGADNRPPLRFARPQPSEGSNGEGHPRRDRQNSGDMIP